MLCAAGRTITAGDADHTVSAVNVEQLVPRMQRKVVLFASSKITDQCVFTNGLFQNIFFLYKIAEILGYTSMFLFNEKDMSEQRPEFMKNARVLILDDLVKNPIPIHAYIEIGMSINPDLRRYLKTLGARVIKLYLGNILNIDIETPTYYTMHNFAHHVVGNSDEIWTSPHYEMHREYAATLNHVPLGTDTCKIAAYIWGPEFITNFGSSSPKWTPQEPSELPTFLIMEPNISFQKASVVPLLILEAFHRANPTFKFKVIVGNGLRLQQVPYSANCFLPNLEIFKKDMIELHGRIDMATAMKKYPHAYPICHNYNNEFNYMTLEYLYCGFPIIHNSPTWSDAGYYYNDDSIQAGVKAVANALSKHADSIDTFVAQGAAIIWRHSVNNPKVQEAWKKLLG